MEDSSATEKKNHISKKLAKLQEESAALKAAIETSPEVLQRTLKAAGRELEKKIRAEQKRIKTARAEAVRAAKARRVAKRVETRVLILLGERLIGAAKRQPEFLDLIRNYSDTITREDEKKFLDDHLSAVLAARGVTI